MLSVHCEWMFKNKEILVKEIVEKFASNPCKLLFKKLFFRMNECF